MGKATTQLGHDAWTHEHGLPGEAVYKVLQSQDGYLWLQSSGGVVRFDGVRFTPQASLPGLEGLQEGIKAMALNREGHLLLRSHSRTLIYREGVFTDYRPVEPFPKGVVRRLFESRSGEIWVGGDAAVFHGSKGPLQMAIDGCSWVYAFHEDAAGALWIGTNHGLYRRTDAGKTSQGPYFCTSITADPKGKVWVGCREGLFPIVQDHADLQYRSPLSGRSVTAILFDRDGNLWVGTEHAGLFRFDGQRWTQFKAGDGLTDNNVLSLMEDREGSLWIGTSGGLDRLRDTKLTPYTEREGLAGNDVYSVAATPEGGVFVFSDGSGLTQIKSDGLKTFTQKQGLNDNNGASLCVSRDGSLWIGTGAGLNRWKNGQLLSYPKIGDGSYISAMIEDPHGLLLALTGGELYRLKEGRAARVACEPAPGSKPSRNATLFSGPFGWDYVFLMHEGKEGDIWLAASPGLFRLKSKGPDHFEVSRITDFAVTCLTEDERGNLWLAGRTPGLMRLGKDHETLECFTIREGLPNNEITALVGDGHGGLWMSTPSGIVLLSLNELETLKKRPGARLQSVVYGAMDRISFGQAGLPERQPAGTRSADGRLWFTTRKGIVMIDPGNLYPNQMVPPILIEKIQADSQVLMSGSKVQLPLGTANLEIHYTALSLMVPERVRFKYRLEGYDSRWVEAGTRRVAFYTHLPPGEYRFTVMACNNDGLWNEQGQSLAFVVQPRFYQRRVFYAGCLLMAGLAFWGLHRLRMHRLSAHARHLARLVAQRTRSLEEQRAFLHQLLEINPDFIFVKDLEGRFVMANRAFIEAFGPLGQSLVGMPEDVLFPDAQEVEVFRQGDAEVIALQQGISLPEQTLRDRQGHPRWLQTAKRPVLDASGQVVQVLTVSTDITLRKQSEEERERLISELQEALAKVRILSGFLPICSACKKIRNDNGYWEQIEGYIQSHSEAEFSHGLCPECIPKLYPEFLLGDSESPEE